jgi:hypothetical protein
MTGPFGGIQSELPFTQIEPYGFQNVENIVFRKGVAWVRPGYTELDPLPAPVDEAIVAIVDFFDASAERHQAVITPTRLLEWDAGWTEITGPGLNGSSSDLFGWDVMGGQLGFSQGIDEVMLWDGGPTYVSTAAGGGEPARYLAEISLHLVAQDVVIGATRFPQTYLWSVAGDPTDWTGVGSGRNDNLNNLGPGRGIVKLGQYGYGFHQWGIVQIIPTGIGTNPFFFLPIVNSRVGNIAPYSLARFSRDGIEQACFLGKDNVYVFNQSSIIPIGDRPIDGQKRYGARTAIFADILAGNPLSIYGYVTQSIRGNIYNAYWLLIPGISIWVYNFDESNWTRLTYDNRWITSGTFVNSTVIRIIDLIGTINDQSWSAITLGPDNPFDGFALGSDEGIVGFVDFTTFSEKEWSITSAQHIFDDRRHSHTLKKFRLAVKDVGEATYTITVMNNYGQSESQTVTLGTGSGDILSTILSFNISGLRIQWIVSGEPEVPGAMVEFAPIFDVSGEQRGGDADGN